VIATKGLKQVGSEAVRENQSNRQWRKLIAHVAKPYRGKRGGRGGEEHRPHHSEVLFFNNKCNVIVKCCYVTYLLPFFQSTHRK
jgi:hypothetical protein